ncbi:RNA polymerase sigma factor [Roseiconus lacunae]|uniref:Sigma-70 family RNA polymerase sigma factor n=1 Tax=Roseiconus lacunae TaxID=2605694 RepID=A0ABT7PGV7_9BACT|nr:sigma-70 family RNA polymerase sigma factor [Roseiconus lacunae]MCD0458182.1 sigma-70 family RNA polymerase sigma factor [Roseiconus lacunae]MDM4015725.1 sigma-70 family RNA polymerase sigma factor [Roseiconus lacunae]WRQ52319.1 sigma-70 family RNA polymerase sigma factor [Stieleria sp. HD01]
MSEEFDLSTSATLLGQLRSRPEDSAAWRRFEARYAPLVSAWCRRWGMQCSDADDVVQEVLLAFSRQAASFEYDTQLSFRGFLRTIARRAWADLLTKRQRQAIATGDTVVHQLLEQHGDGDQFAEQLEAEWKRELLEKAMLRVRDRVQPKTWQAFEELTRNGRSGEQVAELLEMKVGAIWVAKSKVKKMLQEEVAILEQAELLPPRR